MAATTPKDGSRNRSTLSKDHLLLSLLGVIHNAPPDAMSFLTVRDCVQLLLVSKTIHHHLQHVEYTHCKDGRLYQVPFPGYPGVLPGKEEGLFPHQLASLQAMYKAENKSSSCDCFGALRGGILGDAPGLGKTITMLALIASTAGKRPRSPPDFCTDQERQEGWQAFCQNPGYSYDLQKVMKPFLRLGIFPQLMQEIRPPFSLQTFPTMKALERHVQKMVRAHGATEMEMEEFRQNLLQLQAGLHKSHRKLLKSPAGKRQAWERSLVPTSATLLVVPDALLEHWFHQISQHWNRDLFVHDNDSNSNTCQGRGVVYLDGVGDIADARMPLGEVRGNHKQTLPQPWDIAKNTIVVTTFSRCEQEYHKEVELGNLAGGGKTVKKRSLDKKPRRRNDDQDSIRNQFSCSLLNMRWLRVVVDEGHELGTHEGGNGVTRFIHQIAAERRWVLSGTPTTGDEDDINFTSKALDQLQRLLLFLRHPVHGSMPPTDNETQQSLYIDDGTQNRASDSQQEQNENAKEAWVAQVKNPFLQKMEEGRAELLRVLRSVAVLHRKEDIQLPKPIFRNIEVDVPLPDHIQARMQAHPESSAKLLDDYRRTNEFQELVDKAQGGYILKAIQKAKDELQKRGGALEATAGRSMKMMSTEDFNSKNKDQRPIKAVVYSSNRSNLRDVTEVFYSKLADKNIAEAYDDPKFDCGSELSRFRHNCKEIRTCPICSFANDFSGTAKEKRRPPKCKNFLVEVVKRDDQDVRFLVETERIIRALPPNQGGNVVLDRLRVPDHRQYALDRKSWREGDILEVNILDPHPLLKKRQSYEAWQEYGVDKCEDLAERDSYRGSDWFFGPLPVDENGFRTMQVKLKKWQKCSKFHKHTRWYRGPRLAHVPLEAIQENTFILALDAGLSHGLDLSFVTHIFLLEPVDDAALLEQITSRAHRLGATGPVTVETVNPYYKLDPATDAVVKAALDGKEHFSATKTKSESGDVRSLQNRKRTNLTKIVCQYCYRQFSSMEKAVAHENKQCARNPENKDIVDKWHVSSVYREIRPPPPRTTVQQEEDV